MLKKEIDRTGFLSDESLMQLMLLPLTGDEPSEQKNMVRQVVDLAVAIQNDEQEAVALAGILTFSDKIIDKDDAKKIKEVMMMTKVVKLIWDEAHTEGLAEGIMELLSEKGTVSDKLKKKIQVQTDEEILKSWLKAASKAESIEAFQEMIKA